MVSKSEILNILYKDKLRNINLINFINSYDLDEVREYGSVYLLKGTSDKQWIYIYRDYNYKIKDLEKLIKELKHGEKHFAAIDEQIFNIINKYWKIVWKLSCIQLFFPEDKSTVEIKHTIRDLTLRDVKYIYEHSDFNKYISLRYLKDRIIRGIGLGLYDKGGMIAWILTHDDGAMGFLNVLPGFRRKGYATEITSALINRIRAEGGIPFIHIEDVNSRSMNLALKMGFKKDRNVYWMRIEN